MAYAYGPKIETNNLVFCYDSGDKSCYSGTGATINDLSRSGLNPTYSVAGLDAGPIFSGSEAGGSIGFNGVDQIMTIPASSATNLLKDFSFEVWFNKQGVGSVGSAYDSIFQKEGGHSGYPIYGIRASTESDPTNLVMYFSYSATSGDQDSSTIKSNGITIGDWICCTVTVSSDRKARGYYNGEQKGSTLQLDSDLKDEENTCLIGDGDGRKFNGFIPIVRIYNKQLTDDQIRNNFHAQRTRFGV